MRRASVLVVSLGLLACAGRATNAPPANRTAVLPSIALAAAAPVTVGKTTLRATVCKVDPAGAPLASPDLAGVFRGAAVDERGDVYVLDVNERLRRYRYAPSDGCTLSRDDSFGEGGELDMKPSGLATLDLVAASREGVFVSGLDPVRRVVGNAWKAFCPASIQSGELFTSSTGRGFVDGPGGQPGIFAVDLASGDEPCRPRKIALQGAAARAHLVGVAGDVLVVEGPLKSGEAMRTFHGFDGRLLGRAKPDPGGVLGGGKGGSACGPNVCLPDAGNLTAHEVRVWSKSGEWIGAADVKTLLGAAVYPTRLAERDGRVWLFGGARDESKQKFVGVIAIVEGFGAK